MTATDVAIIVLAAACGLSLIGLTVVVGYLAYRWPRASEDYAEASGHNFVTVYERGYAQGNNAAYQQPPTAPQQNPAGARLARGVPASAHPASPDEPAQVGAYSKC